ncbi:MAG: hypothetical protein IJ775_03685 [Muribaculaceae bacterium]|nr:hypothetical protein [Muribaculaceae bacterium]
MLALLTMVVLAMFMPQAALSQQVDPDVITMRSDSVIEVKQRPAKHKRTPVKATPETSGVQVVNAQGDTIILASTDSIQGLENVEILARKDSLTTAALGKKRVFNPDPTRALWLSALCPGLGQIYNRRYWKLPIVVGAFVGLTYATTWNNRMYNDYTRAYRDVMDNDPQTNSYMAFYPPTTQESSLDKEWLKKALRNKKNYYRRYRDICIIGIVGVYALCMIDAYVDAQLAHFEITPDLSMRVKPTVIDPGTLTRTPTVGIQCAINF